jgi:hypothetical protein
MARAVHKCAGYQLRLLWQNVPAALIPKAEPPSRLTPEETRENYLYRLDDPTEGKCCPVDLVQRVRMGVKPIATFLLRCQGKHQLTERALLGAVKAFGLKCLMFYVRGGKREAVVFQPSATLAHFYDPEDTIARYKAARVTLDREIFDAPLESFARALVSGDLPPAVSLPVTGLCFGYPIEETLALLASGGRA